MSQLLKTSATASCALGTRTDALFLYRYVKLVRRIIAEGEERQGGAWDEVLMLLASFLWNSSSTTTLRE
jgi:hypothetical protein